MMTQASDPEVVCKVRIYSSDPSIPRYVMAYEGQRLRRSVLLANGYTADGDSPAAAAGEDGEPGAKPARKGRASSKVRAGVENKVIAPADVDSKSAPAPDPEE